MALVKHGRYSIVGTAGAGSLERMKAKTKVSNPPSAAAPAEQKQTRRKTTQPGASKRGFKQSQAAARKAQRAADAAFAAEQGRRRAATSPEASADRAARLAAAYSRQQKRLPGAVPAGAVTGNGPAWNVFVDVLAAARQLRRDDDAAGVVQLLEQTDTWFADRLNRTPEVLRGAESLTEIAQWARLEYRLLANLPAAGA